MQFMNNIKKQYMINKIKRLCFHTAYFSGSEIYRLLKYDTLKEMIFKIKKGNIKLSSTLLFGKKEITAEEQFVYILNRYITFVKDNFFIGTNEVIIIIEETIKSKYSKVLYSKKEFNKLENHKYYYNSFKRMFLEQVFNNFKKLFNEYNNEPFFKKLSSLSLDNDEDLEQIFLTFKEIINFRHKDLYYFFENTNNNTYGKDLYIIKWKSLINDYIKSDYYVNSKSYKYLEIN